MAKTLMPEKCLDKPVIVDVHVHPKREGVPVIDLILRLMDENCVRISVLLGRDTDPSDVDREDIRRKILERLIKSQYYQRFIGFDDVIHIEFLLASMRDRLSRVTTNYEIAEFVRIAPDRFIGMGSINLSKDENYVKNKIKEIIELNLAGAKFWPQLQFFNPSTSENFRIVAQQFSKYKKIVMVHTGTAPGPWEIPELSEDANPKYLEPILREYDVKVILAHMGYYSAIAPGIWFREALELGKRYSNVYFDISAVAYILSKEKYVDMIRKYVGFDRILFGSDYLEYIEPSINIVMNSQYLSSSEKENVLGFNAIRLFGIKI